MMRLKNFKAKILNPNRVYKCERGEREMLSKFETSTAVEYISIKLELVGIKDLRKGNSRFELINIIPS